MPDFCRDSMKVAMTYLDNAASAPARESSLRAFEDACRVTGNPDSVHSQGQAARAILDQAREEIASFLGCEPVELIFTSGGTESVNLAIRGIFADRCLRSTQRRGIVSSHLEHQAGLASTQFLTDYQNAQLVAVEPEAGVITPSAFQRALDGLDSPPALASLMWVNNETGAITDVAAIARLANAASTPVHSDAVAALGKVPVDFKSSGLAALSICGHKLGAPVGVGALVLRRDIAMQPGVLLGGEQERGLRPGTTNHALAAAMAVAVREAVSELEQKSSLHRSWGERLFAGIVAEVPDAAITIAAENRVPSTLHVQLPQCDSAALVFALDRMGVSVSSGAACQAGVQGPSHVLLGMGYSEQQAARGLRISFGHSTKEQDIATFLGAFSAAYQQALAVTRVS